LPTAEQVQEYKNGGKRLHWGILDPIDSPTGFAPDEKYSDYWVWKRPASNGFRGYNNVACGASITGAARADLLDALCHARNPYYCDTDSIICEELDGVEIHPTKLGAWKPEASIREFAIAGKKLYAYEKINRRGQIEKKVRSKGARGLTIDQLYEIVAGGNIILRNPGITLKRGGEQIYIERTASRTAPIFDKEFLTNGQRIFKPAS
jgi:hypothetical protein